MNVDLPGCISGRKDAWDEFVRQSAPVILAAVSRSMHGRLQHTHDVQDRVQEVYVRLLRENCRLLRTFDPGRASLATWLSLIARTIVHEHHQKRRQPATGLENVDAAAPEPPPRPEPLTGLDSLSQQQRQVIRMLFEEDLSVEQAAARLGVNPQTIRSAKHKALTRLRKTLFSEHPENARDDDAAGLEASGTPD